MNRIDHAIAPIADKQCILELGWELGPGPENDTGRRAVADIGHCTKTVCKVLRPFTGPIAPTKFRAADDVIDTRGAVPGCTDIPFHVRIVSEQIAQRVKGDVVFVSKSGGDQFDVAPIGIETQDETAGCQSIGHESSSIGHPSEHVVLAPVPRHTRTIDALG